MPAGHARLGAAAARVCIHDLDDASVFATGEPFRVVWHEVHPSPPHRGPPGGLDAHEPDDHASRAARIGLGAVQLHTISPRKDEDWIVFTPPAAGTYRFEFAGVTVPLEVRVYSGVAGRGENKYKTLTIRGSGGSFDVPVVPAVRYLKLQVQARDDDDTGVYRLAVHHLGHDGRGRR